MTTTKTTPKSPARVAFLEDTLITAGISYWCDNSDCVLPSEGAAWSECGVTIYLDKEQIERDDILQANVEDDTIVDWGQEKPAWKVRVTLDDLARACGKFMQKDAGTTLSLCSDYVKDVRTANMENDAGELDAGTADAIVQVAVFGKVIFG